MSTISELWSNAKGGLQKEANTKLIELVAKGGGKALAKTNQGLKAVTANIDEVLPAAKQPASKSKGFARVVKPQFAESGPTIPLNGVSYAGSAPKTMKTFKDYVGDVKGQWSGLSSGARNGIKGTTAVGALGLSNMQGRSSGKETGMEEGKIIGSSRGYDAGIADANALQSSMDPGILGRLMEVFTGRQPSMLNTSDPQMAARRQMVIQQILSGNSKSASVSKLLAAAGVGSVGGGLLGHTVGNATGFRDGAGQGYDAGVTAPPAGPSVDPGALARLLEVFIGRQDTEKSLRDTNVERVINGQIVNGKPVKS